MKRGYSWRDDINRANDVKLRNAPLVFGVRLVCPDSTILTELERYLTFLHL